MPCPISIASRVSNAEFAQVRRQQHPAVGVEFQIRGVSDHQALQAPRLRIQVGKRINLRSISSQSGSG